MPELPSPDWTAERYLEWMERSFEYLRFQWDEQTGEKPSWEQAKPDFLQIMDTNEDELASVPQLRVLQLLVEHVDERISGEVERREILLDSDKTRVLLTELIATSRQEQDAAQAGSVTSLSWVTDAQRQKLAASLGADWAAPLTDQLDQGYPRWQEAPPADLETWLDDWMAVITGVFAPPPPPPTVGFAESLVWVTVDQQGELGGDWQQRAKDALVRWYPGWEQQTNPDLLVKWLSDWMPTILGVAPVAPPQPDTLAGLRWLTNADRAKLATLGEDWRDKLRASLDRHYQSWQASTVENVVTWLEGWMPIVLQEHAAPAAPAAPTGPPPPPPASAPAASGAQSVQRIVGDATDALLSDKEELATLMPREELEQLVAEVMRERVAARTR